MKTNNYASLMPKSKKSLDFVIRKHGARSFYSGKDGIFYQRERTLLFTSKIGRSIY